MKEVLVRIIVIVQTLASNNLTFRKSNQKIYERNNRFFCQLIQMIAFFDPMMKEHVRRAQQKETLVRYFGHKI